VDNTATFSFSHLPSPDHLVQVGAALPLPSQLPTLQGRYRALPSPDQLVPDLFTRVAQGLQPLRKPQATDIQPGDLRASASGNAQSSINAAATSPNLNKTPPAPPKPEEPKQDELPGASRQPKPKTMPQYLTREQLMNWQRQLRSNTPAQRQQAAVDIQMFLGKHPETMQNPLERRAMAALTLNLLQDTDVVVRNMGFDILSAGRIKFTPAERRQSPYRELAQRIDRLLKVKDPIYALADYERPEVETLKRNWDKLTTLQPAPPDTEAIPA
jgi:hypothetical protein